MGTGQMMLAIGALVIFTSLAVTVNSSLVGSDESLTENGFAMGALGLGQGLIEEAQRLAFDETLIGTAPAVMPDGFTPADEASLGPELGEAYPDGFDDVDDFDGFDQVVVLAGVRYRLRVRVGYVDPANPAHVAEPSASGPAPWGMCMAGAPTFVKKMEVRVSAAELPVDLSLHHLFAYQP
jgi:hypothetical protein